MESSQKRLTLGCEFIIFSSVLPQYEDEDAGRRGWQMCCGDAEQKPRQAGDLVTELICTAAATSCQHTAPHQQPGEIFLADIKKIYLGHHAGEETTIKCLVMSSNLELGRSKTPLFVNIQARSL